MAEKAHQNVLIVTDRPETRHLVLEVLAAKGVRGTVVSDAGSARREMDAGSWVLVLADVDALNGNTGEFLKSTRIQCPELPVALLVQRNSAEAVLEAVRGGCENFLFKPLGREDLETIVETFLPNHDVPVAAAAQTSTSTLYEIVGQDPGFLEMLELAKKAAPTSVPILITGESGTGKELVSYLVHCHSNRARGPYVRVNCAAMSESLLESELFGHERGAFTGACTQRKGLFERAHGGTLLLDEISETSDRLQAELLRVLEQQDFERVGGSESVRVNVRVVSTSNRDLAADVARRKFRPDLYYRISGVHMLVPALRDRPEDIPILVRHFVNEYAREVRRRITDVDPKMMATLKEHPWPGNVRQLRNVVRTSLIMGEGPTLALGDVAAVQAQVLPTEPRQASTLSLQDVERRAIFEALRQTKSHQAKAARLLGITDRTLREKLRRYRQDGHLPEVADIAGASLGPATTGERGWLLETV